MPVLTISPLNCDDDNYSILAENILGILQSYYWNITTKIFGKYKTSSEYFVQCKIVL